MADQETTDDFDAPPEADLLDLFRRTAPRSMLDVARIAALHASTVRVERAQLSPPRRQLRKKLVRGLITAACVAVGVGAWLLWNLSSPTPVYGLDGIHERFLKIRSLHVTGQIVETVNDVNGVAERKELPVEFYAERPGRLWQTWYGFSRDRVSSGFIVVDGARQLWVSNSDKRAIVTKSTPLAVELRVESNLQNDWTRKIVEHSIADYKLIGKDTVNGIEALQYETEWSNPDGTAKTQNIVWVNPKTGLPVRSARYSFDAAGKRELSVLYHHIETDVHPRADMFTFKPPEYCRLEQKDELADDAFIAGSVQANADHLAARFVLAIDDRAALICWRREKQSPDGPQQRAVAADLLRMEFSGATTKRPCEWHFVDQQQERNKHWTWSLVLPRDHRPLAATERLNITLAEGTSGATMNLGRLRFDDERLTKILGRIQTEAFAEPSPDEAPFTLAGLRKMVDDICAAPADEENDAEKQAAQERKERYTNWMRTYAEGTHVELQRAGDDNEQRVELVPNPVFRYSDEERAIPDATLWVWTHDARPVAFQKVEGNNQGSPKWTICLASLSEGLISVSWSSGRKFEARRPGVTFSPVPGAEPPADTRRARIAQLKALKERFNGEIVADIPGKVWAATRTMPKPIFEYFDPDSRLPLGAIFGMTSTGTNPDLLLLIETRRDGDGKLRWEYAHARMTANPFRVRLDDTEVWVEEWVSAAALENWIYYFLRRDFE